MASRCWTSFDESGLVVCCAGAVETTKAAATADAMVRILKRVICCLSRMVEENARLRTLLHATGVPRSRTFLVAHRYARSADGNYCRDMQELPLADGRVALGPRFALAPPSGHNPSGRPRRFPVAHAIVAAANEDAQGVVAATGRYDVGTRLLRREWRRSPRTSLPQCEMFFGSA